MDLQTYSSLFGTSNMPPALRLWSFTIILQVRHYEASCFTSEHHQRQNAHSRPYVLQHCMLQRHEFNDVLLLLPESFLVYLHKYWLYSNIIGDSQDRSILPRPTTRSYGRHPHFLLSSLICSAFLSLTSFFNSLSASLGLLLHWQPSPSRRLSNLRPIKEGW